MRNDDDGNDNDSDKRYAKTHEKLHNVLWKPKGLEDRKSVLCCRNRQRDYMSNDMK